MKRAIIVSILASVPFTVLAHPGNTDSQGGHHCWTNCESWGYIYGEYHFHNEKSDSSAINTYYDTKSFAEKTIIDVTSYAKKWGIGSMCTLLPTMIEMNYSTAVRQADEIVSFKREPNFSYCEEDYECSLNIKYLQDTSGLLLELIGWLASTSDEYCDTDHRNTLLNKLLDHIQTKYGSNSSSASVQSLPKKVVPSTPVKAEIQKSTSSTNSAMYDRVCPRVVKRFSEHAKMWGRVNERINKRFGFVCPR